MSGEHGHDHGAAAMRAGARHNRPLLISFGLIVALLVVQVVTGIITGSLALLSDAGHMATDALGLGMALAAIQAASKARAHPQRTFGLYRLEILTALVNVVLVFGVFILPRAWKLGREALRVLVQAAPARLDLTAELLAERHGIAHATLQVEPDDHHGCEDVSW